MGLWNSFKKRISSFSDDWDDLDDWNEWDADAGIDENSDYGDGDESDAQGTGGRDWEQVIYGYVMLFISTFCVDRVVDMTRRSVQFFIITEKYEEMGQHINNHIHRGCTLLKGQGVYSGHEVNMLFVLARRTESSRIFALINDIDPAAFVSQSAVIGVYGQGFDHFKGGRKKVKKQIN